MRVITIDEFYAVVFLVLSSLALSIKLCLMLELIPEEGLSFGLDLLEVFQSSLLLAIPTLQLYQALNLLKPCSLFLASFGLYCLVQP